MKRWLCKLAVVCAASIVSIPSATAETVVAALGDSLTHGFGLPAEQGFVPQLQAWIAEQGGDARLINAGVSGDTTAGGLARVGWTLTDDVDALIVALGGNDLLRGIPPENSRSNLAGILRAAAERDIPVLLIGLPAPGNFGPDYKESFDSIFPDLAAEYGTLLHANFLGGLMDSDSPAVPRGLMQPDGIHPNKDGVARVVRDLGPKVLALIERADNR